MVKGQVKWFNVKKGFGFITGEDAKDLFVHYSGIKTDEANAFRTLYEGDKVEYEVTEGQKGPQASNVVVTEKAPRQARPRRGSRKDEDTEDTEETE